MLIDTHCHLFFEELKKDLVGVLSRASDLGVTKFNLIKLCTKKDVISLGGINGKNIKYLRMCNINGFAGISWIKKNGPSINTGPF